MNLLIGMSMDISHSVCLYVDLVIFSTQNLNFEQRQAFASS